MDPSRITSVTVARAILESDWRRSRQAHVANNVFGIKATGRLGNDGLVWMRTSQYDAPGLVYETISPFRVDKNLANSMTDRGTLVLTGRYAVALQAANDPKQFAEPLYKAGYSTQTAYADKLIALMDGYDLNLLDA